MGKIKVETPRPAEVGPASGPGTHADLLARTADLRNSSAFLNLVIENIPAMVAVKDAENLRFVLGNRAGDELTGYPLSEVIGKTDFDFFPREQAEAFVAFDREVLAAGELRVIPEEFISTRHRGIRTLRTLKMPVLDERGRPKYLLAMSEDITERKQAEAALQASEAMFRSLLAASPDAVLVIDEHGLIILASQRVKPMYGYDPEELVGKAIGVLMPERLNAVYDERFRQFVASSPTAGPKANEDFWSRRRDGSEFPIEFSLNPHMTAKGQVIIVAIRDISDRRAVETQLRQALKMEAIGNLTGGLAHDFNNLLSIIIGNVDLLRERLGHDAASDELADQVLSAAMRGADLTRRLLAFARRQPLQPQRIDVNDLVVGISKLLSRTLGANIEIEHRLDNHVWPVTADPVQLEACLVNIVTNARDAMPKGGRLLVATGNRHLDDDYVGMYSDLAPGNYSLIEVTDTGSGMTQETIGRIFEPFFTTKEEGRGTGLGLSMVFGFMKQSGGHINVYSEVGVGTTFRLYLPQAEASAAVAASRPAVTRLEARGQETILAVEDNPGLRDLVVRQLTQLGYRCLEASDGIAALNILESEKVDLLFTDVIIPGGMSGYDLGRTALLRWPAIKVLLTSGFPEEKLNGNGAPPWNMRLLIKPYRRDDLARVLREVLQK